ncbi:MAG: site-specific integrase [Halobacteriota archaeon]|nr:site-specific integrase [Halobacteriota archaeon]
MKSIDGFLSRYSKNNTIKSYRASVYMFLDFYYGKVRQGARATKEERKEYEELNKKYFSEEHDYLDELIRFVVWMDGKPPATIKVKISGVKEWLSYNEIELTPRQLKTLQHKLPNSSRGWTDEKDIERDTLKQILSHTDEKGRALILTLASSGMRIGELLKINFDDMDLSSDPPEITVRGEYTKSGQRRTVFISKEAKQSIDEWLKIRDSYLLSSVNRNKGLIENGEAKAKQIEDDRIFPFSDSTVRELWANALRKSELNDRDPSTGRLKYRIHGMRKFFRSQLALSCPVDIVESLMGHEGYLTDAYRRYTQKQLGEYYLKGEHHLTVFESGDLAEIQESLRDTQMAMFGYKSSLDEKDELITHMGKKIEMLERRIFEVGDVDRLIDLVLENLMESEEKREKFIEMLGSG